MDRKQKNQVKTKKTQKKAKVRYKKIIAVSVLILSGYMIFNLLTSIKDTLAIRYDISAMKEEREKLLKEKASLENELEKLDDEEYITRYAREHYIFTREGESVVVLPSTDENE